MDFDEMHSRSAGGRPQMEADDVWGTAVDEDAKSAARGVARATQSDRNESSSALSDGTAYSFGAAEETTGLEAETSPDGQQAPLLAEDQRLQLSNRWNEIQAEFVDHPRQSVESADALVVDVMQRVTSGLSQERERLETQWETGDNVSTEDLRIALTHYRSFFERLLAC